MAEFTVGDKQYRSGKLNAFEQFHIARKIAPILSKMGETKKDKDANASPGQADLAGLLSPMLDALAEMPEEDCNYVLYRCLGVVQRHQGGSMWAPVWNPSAKRLQFEDIDMQVMIQITMNVLGDNLGNFLNTPVPALGEQASPELNTPQNLSPFPTTKTG